jgi:hypothetical protein
MAKSKFSGAPIAPSRISLWQTVRLKSQGRRDAKKYLGLKDYTRTHALIVAQSKAQAGQHEVNQWLIKQIEPLQVGNSRLAVIIENLKDELSQVKARKEASPRLAKANLLAAQKIQKQVSNERAQFKANKAAIVSLVLSGEEALNSWESLYAEMAGVYTRARAMKSKQDIAAVASEVPVFQTIEIARISDFESTEK